jgi:hypothetical protein
VRERERELEKKRATHMTIANFTQDQDNIFPPKKERNSIFFCLDFLILIELKE